MTVLQALLANKSIPFNKDDQAVVTCFTEGWIQLDVGHCTQCNKLRKRAPLLYISESLLATYNTAVALAFLVSRHHWPAGSRMVVPRHDKFFLVMVMSDGDMVRHSHD